MARYTASLKIAYNIAYQADRKYIVSRRFQGPSPVLRQSTLLVQFKGMLYTLALEN